MENEEIRRALRSQYGAAFAMMRAAMEQCPASAWNDASDANPVWQVAYHALFYAYLYLQPSLAAFQPSTHHRAGYEDMQMTPAPACTPAELLAFLATCQTLADTTVATLDPAAPSGFHWLPMNKLELQIYNIRHLQTHAGELAERLGQRAGGEVPWVSRDG